MGGPSTYGAAVVGSGLADAICGRAADQAGDTIKSSPGITATIPRTGLDGPKATCGREPLFPFSHKPGDSLHQWKKPCTGPLTGRDGFILSHLRYS